MLARIGPASLEIADAGQQKTRFGRKWSESFRIRPKSGQGWRDSGHMLPEIESVQSCTIWAAVGASPLKFGRSLSRSADLGPEAMSTAVGSH